MEINICVNCSERTGSKYCSFCNTAEKRKAMDEENQKIREEGRMKKQI